MDPRISFSNDFVDAKLAIKHENNNIYREAPVSSSDFEFSVKNYSMISADEVFFQGMLLPLKSDHHCSKKMTLRDELLVNDDEGLPRLPKSSSRWKERLGFRRGAASKKDKNKSNDGLFLQRVAEDKVSVFGHGDTTVGKDNLDLFYEEGLSSRGK